jgi:hypothetical protein
MDVASRLIIVADGGRTYVVRPVSSIDSVGPMSYHIDTKCTRYPDPRYR